MKTPLKISILLNLGLLAGLVLLLATRPVREVVRPPIPVVDNPPLENTKMAVTPPNPAPTATPPFRWSQLDAKDYHVYVKHLRAIGCPESTVRAIVRADVHAVFSCFGQEMRDQFEQLEAAPWPSQFANLESEQALKRRMQELPGAETAKINDLLGLASAPAEAVASLAAAAQPADGGDASPAMNQREARLAVWNETALANSTAGPTPAEDATTPVAAAGPLADMPLPTPPNSAELPLVFQPVDPARTKLTAAQTQVVNDLRQQFAATLNSASQNPADPAYQQAWQQAQFQSDRLLEANLGQNAYNQYWDAQWDAQHPASLAGQATPAQ
jgi:hypothetical protein